MSVGNVLIRARLLAGAFTIVTLFVIWSVPSDAVASSIAYTVQGFASGSLGSNSFTDAEITVTFTGDTANISEVSSGLFKNQSGIATITVQGVGKAQFTDNMAVFDVQSTSVAGLGGAGIQDLAINTDVLDTGNSAFTTYALQGPIGPVSGPALGGSPVLLFQTTLGDLMLSVTSTSTFTASIVPEPSTITLTAIGFLLLNAVTRSRRA